MLVQYSSSSSSSSSSSDEEPICKKKKLEIPLPGAMTMLGPKKSNIANECKGEDGYHDGRIRSFPHERGNWATYVYISMDDVISTIEDIAGDIAFREALREDIDLQNCKELHMSLSKTFVLQYHLIESFVKSLSDAFDGCERISLGNLKVYVNEERTRTFIAFIVDDLYCEKLKVLLKKVDMVLNDYKLPLFYQPASFHVSFLWCLGDQVQLLNRNLDKLRRAVESMNDIITVKIDAVRCKSGNKEFNFKLK